MLTLIGYNGKEKKFCEQVKGTRTAIRIAKKLFEKEASIDRCVLLKDKDEKLTLSRTDPKMPKISSKAETEDQATIRAYHVKRGFEVKRILINEKKSEVLVIFKEGAGPHGMSSVIYHGLAVKQMLAK